MADDRDGHVRLLRLLVKHAGELRQYLECGLETFLAMEGGDDLNKMFQGKVLLGRM